MSELYYDLTEQFFASGAKFKYYGIARTVMEVGYELAQLDKNVRFVFFSPGHGQFLEVQPRIGSASPTGLIDPGVMPSARPMRLRQTFPNPNPLRDMLHRPINHFINRKNLARFAMEHGEAWPVNLHGKALVSLGRPKLMSDYLRVLERRGQRPFFAPLLHDMIPLHTDLLPGQKKFPANFLHDNVFVMQRSSLILSNSNFTKSEIERFSGSGVLPAADDVETIALCHELRESVEPVHLNAPQRPYLLCVGSNVGRKNAECAVQALKVMKERGQNVPDLVFAGAQRNSLQKYVDQPELAAIRQHVQFVLNPNQSELRMLYENALALVIPSKMEGWGLPLGEALWLGTPGFAASVPALQEVGRDLARYFAPEEPVELADLAHRLMRDEEYRQQERRRIGAARSSLRTWQDVASDLVYAMFDRRRLA